MIFRELDMTAPCYLCGVPMVLEGLCTECYNTEHPLVRIPPLVSILSCKKCGAVKIPGGWKTLRVPGSDVDETLDEQVEIGLTREITRLVKDITYTAEEEKRLDRILHITLVVTGQSHSSLPPHEERYPVEIRLNYGTCDTCGMMSGGYYDAVLQVRALDRFLTEDEENEITSIVTERTINEYGKDDKAFVTSVTTTRFGPDFYIGSEHLTRLIATELEAKYLAERKENYKLTGQQKGGKDKFRVTILIRLPRYSLGDFIKVSGHPCQALAMGKGGLTCYDLIDRTQFTINPKSSKWRSIEFIMPQDEQRQYMVVSRSYSQPVQIMDQETFEVVDIEDDTLDPSIEAGQIFFALHLDDRIYPLPVKSGN
ncbi:MAG: NMD3-related protein [Candidatus Thorarchaeota archaeon]